MPHTTLFAATIATYDSDNGEDGFDSNDEGTYLGPGYDSDDGLNVDRDDEW